MLAMPQHEMIDNAVELTSGRTIREIRESKTMTEHVQDLVDTVENVKEYDDGPVPRADLYEFAKWCGWQSEQDQERVVRAALASGKLVALPGDMIDLA